MQTYSTDTRHRSLRKPARRWTAVVAVVASGLLAPPSLSAQPSNPRCDALAALSTFTIISTKETDRRDLYLGSDVTVGTVDNPGTCSLDSGLCGCLTMPCAVAGRRCVGDQDCLPAPRLRGRAIGGVCGNDMVVTAGNRMGLLATRGDVDFGGMTKCRIIRLEAEFANTPGGRVKLAHEAPFLGPTARRDDGSTDCSPDSSCDGGCVTGRRLVVGAGGVPLSSSDGQARRGLAGTGSSLRFKRCDAALSLLEATGSDRSFGPSPFQLAIENFSPRPSERVSLNPGNCRACPLPTSPDSSCGACAATDLLRTRARTQKLVVTLGGGLQVVDVPRVALQGNTVLELRGQSDTVALIRVVRGLRLGAQAKIVLASNGSGNGTLRPDKLLWVARGLRGGRPNISGASTFRGTLLASGRIGIRLGASALVEGALWSRKVSVGGQSVVQHYPFSELFPLPGSASAIFTPVGPDLEGCLVAP